MKSIQLEIAQSESDPTVLFWKVSSPGKSGVQGSFHIEAENEAARFLACAAHAFQAMGIFHEAEPKRCQWISDNGIGCELAANHTEMGINHLVMDAFTTQLRDAFIKNL